MFEKRLPIVQVAVKGDLWLADCLSQGPTEGRKCRGEVLKGLLRTGGSVLERVDETRSYGNGCPWEEGYGYPK